MIDYLLIKLQLFKDGLISHANERYFNTGIWLLTIGVIYYLVDNDTVNINSVIGMFAGISLNVALLLIVCFGLQKFQMGMNRDIQKEIFDEHNTAAAIYQLGIWLSVAIVISKGLM